VAYTDCWAAYAQSFPASRQRAGGKATGGPSKLERGTNTRRQRIARRVRKPWSFSQTLVNPVGAIGRFVPHYHASLGL